MKKTASQENYLKAIYILKKLKGYVRSVDLSDYMEFSKPSISIAVKKLQAAGFVVVDQTGNLILTDVGMQEAEQVFFRHCYFEQLLLDSGIELKQASEDACRLEHAISKQSFEALKKYLNREKEIPL